MTVHHSRFLLAGVGVGMEGPGIGEDPTTRFRHINNLVLRFSGELTDAHCIILLGNFMFHLFVCSTYYRIKF